MVGVRTAYRGRGGRGHGGGARGPRRTGDGPRERRVRPAAGLRRGGVAAADGAVERSVPRRRHGAAGRGSRRRARRAGARGSRRSGAVPAGRGDRRRRDPHRSRAPGGRVPAAVRPAGHRLAGLRPPPAHARGLGVGARRGARPAPAAGRPGEPRLAVRPDPGRRARALPAPVGGVRGRPRVRLVDRPRPARRPRVLHRRRPDDPPGPAPARRRPGVASCAAHRHLPVRPRRPGPREPGRLRLVRRVRPGRSRLVALHADGRLPRDRPAVAPARRAAVLPRTAHRPGAHGDPAARGRGLRAHRGHLASRRTVGIEVGLTG